MAYYLENPRYVGIMKEEPESEVTLVVHHKPDYFKNRIVLISFLVLNFAEYLITRHV